MNTQSTFVRITASLGCAVLLLLPAASEPIRSTPRVRSSDMRLSARC